MPVLATRLWYQNLTVVENNEIVWAQDAALMKLGRRAAILLDELHYVDMPLKRNQGPSRGWSVGKFGWYLKARTRRCNIDAASVYAGLYFGKEITETILKPLLKPIPCGWRLTHCVHDIRLTFGWRLSITVYIQWAMLLAALADYYRSYLNNQIPARPHHWTCMS